MLMGNEGGRNRDKEKCLEGLLTST
jgi:hypothetical protein